MSFSPSSRTGKPRILMVSLGYAERTSTCVRQAEELVKYYDVGFVFPARLGEESVTKRRYRRFPVLIRTPRGLIMRPFALLEFMVGLWKVARIFRPDVIHAHNLHTLFVCYPLARIMRTKLVHDAHELAVDMPRYARRPITRRVLHFWNGWLSRRCDLVIAAIESRADIMKREYNLRTMPLVIHNSPASRKPVHSTRAQDFLAGMGHLNAQVVLYQGILPPKKRRLEELIRSAKYFPKDVYLILLGYGNREHFARIIQDEQLQQQVFLHEPVYGEAYYEFTCSADLGVVMYSDTCRNHLYCAPSKVYEYAMAGIPMVGNALPTLQDYFEKEGIGVIANSTEPGELARAITELLTDKDRYAEMKRNCFSFGHKYTWEKEKSKLTEAYKGMCSL